MEVSYFKSIDGWLVGRFGLNDPLRPYLSLYRAVSQREGERTSLCKCRGLCMVHVFHFTLSHSVYSIFDILQKKNSRIRNKQMFTSARAFSRVSYFLYFFCFSHMFCGKKVVVVFP